MDQNEIFRRTEGNGWYARNKPHLGGQLAAAESEDVRFICATLAPFQDRVRNVLEIGCSSGMKLEAICERLAAHGEGLEPSQVAVDEGNSRAKSADIRLRAGSGEMLPFESQSFDLVYFAFCLYLFDRKSLLQSLAEAERVLKPGGFLAVTDFDPGTRQKRAYSHFEGVYSFKQDYAAIYAQSGLYYLMGKHAFSHRRNHFDEEPGERVSTSILYKEVDAYPSGA